MKALTLQEAKDQIAVMHGWSDWQSLLISNVNSKQWYMIEGFENQAMKAYSLSCQEALREEDEAEQQNRSFALAEKLNDAFDFTYAGDDKPQYAYEIESHIRGILQDLNLKLVPIDRNIIHPSTLLLRDNN